MIFYATKETMERFEIVPTQEMSSRMRHQAGAILKKEGGDRLLEWGVKLFYFDRRKCLQFVNFESKLTIFLIDVKMNLIEQTGGLLLNYIYQLYKENGRMTRLLDRYFKESPIAVWDRLKDKSVIATLNQTQSHWAKDGLEFYNYISNGILHSKKIISDINNWQFTKKVDNKTLHFEPIKEFERLLIERYK